MALDGADDTRLTDVLLELGTVLLNDQTVERILELVTELTERTVRTASSVSVTLEPAGRPFTSNATAGSARTLDEAQYAEDDGPCLHALRTGTVVNARIGDGLEAWPLFAASAVEVGVCSVLSMPLTVRGAHLGGLNIYSPAAELFTDVERATAELLAQQGATVLANVTAYTNATAQNDQLRDALGTRDLIGQAKGIIMAREDCDADAAFDVLRRASQRANRKLRDIAAELVSTTNRRSEVAK